MNASATAITRSSNSSFYYSFSLLPRQKREAIHTVYAFCRTTDDIVDEERDEAKKMALLQKWRTELEKALRGNSAFPLLNQLSVTATRFHIPVEHFYELIRGMEMDLSKTRYRTFEELREYCYLVASSVGLMCRKIFGYRNESTREYAINLGIALQLTNILRDIKDDAKRGRIYIPQEDMARFGYTEDDLLNSRYTPQFVELMRFECQRASSYYDLAREALQDEDKRFFFPARIMWSIYAHTLNRIVASNYNVFERRISISKFLKLLITFRYWLSHRLKYSWLKRGPLWKHSSTETPLS
ncbi:MAG TPA: presqualene diphosphate synthase HpnD [Bacteroidota bacterium]|nr:presqualene diphosphate synthase HpnD [Bacteroidota bacterium]